MTKSLTPVGKILKEIDDSDLLNFRPTAAMERAKYRFWSVLKDNHLRTTEIGSLTLDALAMHSGSKSFMDWADKHPMFLAWFCDEQFEQLTLETLAQKAIRRIDAIIDGTLEPKVLTAKDQLNAANMALQLADKFPNKRREFVYVDKELARMSEADVTREERKLDIQLESSKQIDVDDE